MTDEKLDRILQEALAPEIDVSEIQIRRKADKTMRMRKIVTVGLAACAALALMVGGDYLAGRHAAQESAVPTAETGHYTTSLNLFAITAYAADLPEETESGDVLGIRRFEAGSGSYSYLDGRFTISGQNIDTVKIATDKCELYTSVPVCKDDPDYENAVNFEGSDREFYEGVLKEGDPGDDPVVYYDHTTIVGPSYEGEYNDQMSFGISIPEELWRPAEDYKDSFWETVDQADGAVLTVEVTFDDGSTETHHYRLNTGKIYVPVDADGRLQWDQLTRFLTAEEEEAGTPFAYGYLMEKID